MIYCYLFKAMKTCNLKTQITRISAKNIYCLKVFFKCDKTVDQLMIRKITVFIYYVKYGKFAPHMSSIFPMKHYRIGFVLLVYTYFLP